MTTDHTETHDDETHVWSATTAEQLTADELRLAATAIDMWESEYSVGDDWTEEHAVRDKLLRMADALDAEEHQ